MVAVSTVISVPGRQARVSTPQLFGKDLVVREQPYTRAPNQEEIQARLGCRLELNACHSHFSESSGYPSMPRHQVSWSQVLIHCVGISNSKRISVFNLPITTLTVIIHSLAHVLYFLTNSEQKVVPYTSHTRPRDG